MAVFDVVFWEQRPLEGLFRVLQTYGFRVYRIKPALGEKLLEFFDIHSAGVIVTDRWNEIERFPPRIKESFVIAVVDGSDEEVWNADFVVKRSSFNGAVSQPLVRRLVSFVMKARKLVELTRVSEEDEDWEILETLSQEERTLYELLASHQEGVSSRHISLALGWAPNKIRVYIYRLRHKLGQFGLDIVKEGRYYRLKEAVLT